MRTFSGGMRRRLDLAAALVHRPPVLFLDEPTTGLDPQGRIELWGVIEDLAATGVTVLLTTQYLEEADRLADYIVVVDHGLVIAEGTASELKERLGATVIEVGLRDADDAPVAAERLAHGRRRGASTARSCTSTWHGDGATAMLETVRMLDGGQARPDDAWCCGSRPSTTCSSSSPVTSPRRRRERGRGHVDRPPTTTKREK